MEQKQLFQTLTFTVTKSWILQNHRIPPLLSRNSKETMMKKEAAVPNT
jgi:hypothetical protein